MSIVNSVWFYFSKYFAQSNRRRYIVFWGNLKKIKYSSFGYLDVLATYCKNTVLTIAQIEVFHQFMKCSNFVMLSLPIKMHFFRNRLHNVKQIKRYSTGTVNTHGYILTIFTFFKTFNKTSFPKSPSPLILRFGSMSLIAFSQPNMVNFPLLF